MTPKSLDIPKLQETEAHRLAYYEWESPAAAQTIIGVHGLTRNGRDFDVFAAACPEYRVLCPDMPGRGESSRLVNKASYHYGTYVSDMVYFLEAQKLKDIYWVGTSMGGLIGMVLAATFPQYIKKLVMNDIGPFLPKPAIERLAEYVGKEVSFHTIEEVEKYLRVVMAPWGIQQPEHWRHMAEHSFKKSGERFVLNYDPDIKQAFFAIKGDIDMWELWAKVTCPVLVLKGETSDLLTTETAERMRASRSGVEVIEFTGIGHAPALMEENQITKVKEWLAHS